MKQFYIFVLFTTLYMVVQGANIETLLLRHPRAEFVCTKPGPACEDCSTAVECTDLGNGEWETIVVDTCDKNVGFTCLNGECTNKTNPGCNTGGIVDFPCTALGVFPDPFDCQIYHVCCSDRKGSKSTVDNCDANHMYDPLSTYCKTAMPSTGCPASSQIPPCKVAGERGAVAKNKSIYYICTYQNTADGKRVLYPEMHLCPNGKMYSNGKCI